MTHTYHITGMTCGNCVAKVKSQLLKLSDVLSAEVQLSAPQATITMQNHISTVALQHAIREAGNYTLTEADGGMHHSSAAVDEHKNSYFPIFLIFGYIALITLVIQFAGGTFHWMNWMQYFMAGFFLVFSFFKFLNLKGFVEGYSTYDIIAKKLPVYGYVYPFIEAGLGLAFLIRFNPVITNWAALIVMAISSIGVIQSLLKKTSFQCACLGTIIKLPLSKVTVFEDLLMVAMAAVMLMAL